MPGEGLQLVLLDGKFSIDPAGMAVHVRGYQLRQSQPPDHRLHQEARRAGGDDIRRLLYRQIPRHHVACVGIPIGLQHLIQILHLPQKAVLLFSGAGLADEPAFEQQLIELVVQVIERPLIFLEKPLKKVVLAVS